MKRITCSVVPALAEELSRMAAKKGMSLNQFLRGILEKYSIVHGGNLAEEDFDGSRTEEESLSRLKKSHSVGWGWL